MINKFKEHFRMLLTITIVILIIFGLFLFFDRPFILSADQQLQYNIFYQEWVRLIKDFLHGGDLPMYSWNSFLGSDFYSSQAYYVVGDIFMPIILLFDHFDHISGINNALFFETILCVYISAISMRLFLKEHGIKKDYVLDNISIIYSISGWALLFFGQYMFHRFYAFLPLLFYGLEKILNNKKNYVFVFSVTVLFLQNYYLMFPTSVFLLIYGIFSTINRGFKFKQIIKYGLYSLICYLIGLALSAFLTLPALTFLVSNPRVGNYGSSGILWEIQTYFGFFFNLISSPFPIFTKYNNIFAAGTNGHQTWYSLFVGIIPVITCIQMFFYKKYRPYYFTLITLILILLFKPLSSIMHGFSEPSLRWTFLLILFILLMSSRGLDDDIYSREFTSKIFYSYAFCFLIFILLAFLFRVININFMNHFISLIVSFAIAALIFYVFRVNKKIALVLMVIQMCLADVHLMYIYNASFYKYNESMNYEFVDYFRSMDDDLFFRYLIDNSKLMPTSDMNLNKSIQFHYMGLSSYNTLYDTNILEFLKLNNINWHLIDLNDDKLATMLGVKYFLVTEENELPKNREFEYSYNINHYMAYKYSNFKGFGYSASNVDYFKNINELNEFDETIFVDDENIDISNYRNLKESNFIITERGNSHLKGNIASHGKNILQIPIPNNKGWKIIRNGKPVNSISVNGGFLGIEIEDGVNNIELYFISPNFKKGIIISISGLLCLILFNLIIFIRLKKLKGQY